MPTAVQELMSSPPITCDVDASLTEATSLMNSRQIGSVVVTDHRAIVGILTERDLLRASATSADPLTEPVRRWMTADPDVLALDDEVVEAWSGLTHHHYRHLPVVDDGRLVGVVSIRDLLTVAQIRPADEVSADVPRGLEGVVVAETSVGDVRGQEGFFHYRQYSATELAGPAIARGRLATAVRRRAPRSRRLGTVRRRGGRSAGHPRRAGGDASHPGRRWDRRSTPSAPRVSMPRRRARLAADPRHRPPGAAGPGPPPLRGRPHRCSPPSTACSRARIPSPRVTIWGTPPTTCGCCLGRRLRPPMSGPSRSTWC